MNYKKKTDIYTVPLVCTRHVNVKTSYYSQTTWLCVASNNNNKNMSIQYDHVLHVITDEKQQIM